MENEGLIVLLICDALVNVAQNLTTSKLGLEQLPEHLPLLLPVLQIQIELQLYSTPGSTCD